MSNLEEEKGEQRSLEAVKNLMLEFQEANIMLFLEVAPSLLQEDSRLTLELSWIAPA